METYRFETTVPFAKMFTHSHIALITDNKFMVLINFKGKADHEADFYQLQS